MSSKPSQSNSNPPKRATSQASPRANLLFALYVQAGQPRSLSRLRDDLQALGVTVSLTTLKRYSARFGWQERVARFDEGARDRQEARSLEQVLAMNERQAQLGRSLQGAAASSLQSLLRESGRITDVSPAEIARLADTGTKLERLALGEATERQDVIVGAWNTIVHDVVDLFQTVNVIPDQDARAAAFARGLDELVDRQLTAGRRQR